MIHAITYISTSPRLHCMLSVYAVLDLSLSRSYSCTGILRLLHRTSVFCMGLLSLPVWDFPPNPQSATILLFFI